MPIYTYEYQIKYGKGQGIVVAKSRKKAVELVKESPYYINNSSGGRLKLTVIKLSNGKPQIYDFSWSE